MASEEFIVCRQLGNEWCCFKEAPKNDDIKKNQALNKVEVKIAEAAKQGAIKILKDALKKKDKVLMRIPTKVITKGEAKYPFWMKRHAILTEVLVKKLLEELKKVRFQKNIYKQGVYAYVQRYDRTRTIYLCSLFWNAPEYLKRNSQPGILIHEVSHFLGTNDIAYGDDVKPTLYIGCKGVMVKGNLRPALNSSASPFEDNFQVALQKAFWNADNVEYEFELTINHKGSYVGGKYSCCGETARYSVCDRSVPAFFHTCRVGEKWEIEPLVKELCRRSEEIKGKLREHQRIAEIMEESRRKTKTSGNIAHSMNIAGAAGLGAAAAVVAAAEATAAAEAAAAAAAAAATGASVILAPSTFGVSLLMGGCIGVAVFKVGDISMRIFERRPVTQNADLDAIFAEYQCFFDEVKTFITWLKDALSIDWVFQSYVLLKNLSNNINLIIEQIESKENDWQKIMSMKSKIEQLCSNIEQLCKILLE